MKRIPLLGIALTLFFAIIFACFNLLNIQSYEVVAQGLNKQDLQSSSHDPNSNSDMILDQLLQKIINHTSNPNPNLSMVVGVVSANGTQVSAYGNLSDTNQTKVDSDTVFDIASVTKTFTSILLMDMVKRGLVNLDDPLDSILPANVSVPSYQGHKITLENLATHTSGLPKFSPGMPVELILSPGWEQNRTYTNQQVYNMFSNIKLPFEPGTKTLYSNTGSGMLGHALELRTGIPYDQLLKTQIFDVLGMNSSGIGMNATTISIPDDIQQRFAKGHQGGKEIGLLYVHPLSQPSGAIYSTVNDLLKYLSANIGLMDTAINDAMRDTHQIRHQFAGLSKPNFVDPSGHKSPLYGYIGLGWFVITNLGQDVVWHDGGISGFTSWLGFNPEKRIGLVILCSCDDKDAPLGVNNLMMEVAIPYLLFYA